MEPLDLKPLESLDSIFSKFRVFNLFKVKNDGKYVFRTCNDEPNFMGTFSGTEITIDLEVLKKRPDFIILIEKFETEEPLSNCGSLRRIESGPFSSLNFPNR